MVACSTDPAAPADRQESASPADAPPDAPAGSQPASAPGSQPGSQPGGPASAASLPAGHSTSTVAIDLDELFRMPDVSDDVVVSVGDRKFTAGDLEGSLRTLQVQMRAVGIPSNITRYEVLSGAVYQLADRARREQLAKELKVKLDRRRVNAWLADLEARMEAKPAFKAFLLQAGKDAKTRQQDAEAAILWQQVQEKILDRIMDDSEAVARDYYDRNPQQFTDHAGVQTWRIFIPAPRGMVQRDRDIARTRAERVHAQAVENPDNFEELARQYSRGGKGPHGGYIGWVARNTLPEATEDLVFAAKPNTVLPLQEAPIGFYIYKVGRTRKESKQPFDSVKKDILQKVFPARLNKRVEEYMTAQRARHPVETAIPELERLEAEKAAGLEATRVKREQRSAPAEP